MRRLFLTLLGFASLVVGLLVGVTAPVGASGASECAGDVVVALDIELMARPGRSEHVHPLATPIPAGEWSVTTVSHDEGDDRRWQDQPREQWTLTFGDGATVGPTTDLADRVESATRADELGVVTLAAPVDALTLRHVKAPVRGGTQSVTAVCVGLTRVAEPTPPPPSTLPPPPPSTTPPAPVPDDPVDPVPPAPRPAPRPSGRVAPAPPPPAPDLEPSVWINCTTGNAVVVVHNHGTAGAVVDLAVSGAGVATGLEVAAGEAIGTSIPLDAALEDTTVDIRVHDTTTGEIMVIADEPVDCLADAAPEVGVDVDCGRGTAVVTLHNGGEAPTELTVIHERVGALDPVVVAAGDTVDVEVPLAGDELALRVVDGDGVDVVRRTIAVGCAAVTPDDGDAAAGPTSEPDDPDPAPATVDAAVDIDCAGPAAFVDVVRDGEGSERIVVLVDGDVAEILDLDGSESRRVELDVAGADEVSVSRAGSETLIVAADVPCRDDSGGGTAGLVASSLVVVAVLASAAGVVPWPLKGAVAGA